MSLDTAILPLVETQYLPAAPAIFYTAEAGQVNLMVRFTSIMLANQDTSIRTVTLHKVPAGGAVAGSNMILPACTIPPKTLMVISSPEGVFVLPTGATLRAFADLANLVTITCSGEKYS